MTAFAFFSFVEEEKIEKVRSKLVLSRTDKNKINKKNEKRDRDQIYAKRARTMLYSTGMQIEQKSDKQLA